MRRIGLAASFAILALGSAASAQTYPTKPIHAVIPFGAGSATDIVPRMVFDPLAAQLGQPIIVENRVGAGGTLGAAMVAKAEPDGYTLLATSSGYTVTPSMYSNLTYDAANDLTGVGMIGAVPNVFITSPSKGFKTLKEFVAAAKAKPNSMNFASVGVGSAVHISAERFRLAAGYEAVHVPFRSGAEGISEVLSGRIDYYFCPIATALPFIKEGKLLALAVSSPQRAAGLPDVPTTLELGYPDSDYTVWIGLFAPSKTPPAVVAKLHDQLTKAVSSPALKDKLELVGVEPLAMTTADMNARVKKEIIDFGPFAKAANLKGN